MDRRSFIRGIAAALPAGVVATQVRAETDPIRAAYLALCEAIKNEAERNGADGWATVATSRGGTPVCDLSFYMPDGSLKRHQIEGLRHISDTYPAT
jgi:hypothetical protein